ncbi:hypothetical protein DUNSADRAFT_13727 [Dunaliella salina]|uniref:Encoded protein n=1 Tax=Dunaliella salina TaxID=3046 RepID=A0ABQ7H3A9_DUNSA|nr:hypothetical protein DUNSADRAFT_13727 [Dunaliella salina]|eukprot:KAF5841273.1 hypothetical protein DUNSADRAFT_13727 [Dunaliella salina]
MLLDLVSASHVCFAVQHHSSSTEAPTGSSPTGSRPTGSSMGRPSGIMSHESLGRSGGAGGSCSEAGTSPPGPPSPLAGGVHGSHSGPIPQFARLSSGVASSSTPPGKKPGVLKQFTSKLVRTLSKVGSGKSSSPKDGSKAKKESSTGCQAPSRSSSASSFLSSATHFLKGSGNLGSPRSSRAFRGKPKPQVGTASPSTQEDSAQVASAPQPDIISPPLSSIRGTQMPPPQGIPLGGGVRGQRRISHPHGHHVAFTDSVVVGDDAHKGPRTHSSAQPSSRHMHCNLQEAQQQAAPPEGSPRALGRSKSSNTPSPSASVPLPVGPPDPYTPPDSHTHAHSHGRLSWGVEHARGPLQMHEGTGAAHTQPPPEASPPTSVARSSRSTRPSITR